MWALTSSFKSTQIDDTIFLSETLTHFVNFTSLIYFGMVKIPEEANEGVQVRRGA